MENLNVQLHIVIQVQILKDDVDFQKYNVKFKSWIFVDIKCRGGSRIFLRRGAPVRNGVTDFIFAEYQLY